MGRLVPAGTGMEYYRQVKIAGEDVVEEPVAEPPIDAIPGYDEETRLQYAGVFPKIPAKNRWPSKQEQVDRGWALEPAPFCFMEVSCRANSHWSIGKIADGMWVA